MHPLIYLGIGFAGLLFGLYKLLQIGGRPKDLPPGPPTKPIFGNILDMPTRDAHLQFKKWAEEYGPVYSLIFGTKTLIVLSSDQAVKDLLDKKSGIYSSRQDMYIGQKLCSDDLRMLMMKYSPQWRMVRKMVHNLLNVTSAQSYVPYQDLESKQMLYDFLRTPDDFLHHVRRYSNSLTTSFTFGWRTPTYYNPATQQLFDGFEDFSLLNQTGTAAMIDFFPILRRLPDWLLPTQRFAKEHHKKEKALYVKLWLNCKQAILAGQAKPCFCVNMAKVQEAEEFSDDLAAYISGTLLEAGSDTTSNTLYGFIKAMVLFPEAQKKAQAQLDEVVGPNRLPTMEDEPKLQYIRGCVKESLRWCPTTILGAVPHAVTQDDWYNGYRIPSGAGVLNNVWTINNNPARYPEPRRFDPDRYANDFLGAADAAANPDASKRDHVTFGAGRRICPGIHVAERSLFLGISRLLWAFDFEPARNADGSLDLPDRDAVTQGFVAMAMPFRIVIKPRSEDRVKKIKQEWAEAQKQLDPKTHQWVDVPKGVGLGSMEKNVNA